MWMRAVLLGTVLGLASLLSGATPPAWVPMRWPSSDPASLALLDGTPINCLLVRSWTADFARAAAARKLAVLAIVAGEADAAKAVADGLAGVVLEGDYPAEMADRVKAATAGKGALLVELPLRSRMRLDAAAPIVGTAQGVWPGVHLEEGGAAKAGPTGSPWIDTNHGFLRSVRSSGASTVWIANQPPRKEVVTAQRYLQAIADAAISGARWVVALDDDFSARLLQREAAAVRDFGRIAQHLRFYEDHPEWRSMKAYGRLAILQDPSKGGTLSGGILDMIGAKHTPVRAIPPQKLSPDALAGAKMAVNLETEGLNDQQRDILRGFTRGGGTLLTAPPGWKDQGAHGQQITLDKQEIDRLNDIFRDVQAMVGRRNLGVRLFNVSSMLSNLVASADGKEVVVHLVNYSGYTVENIAVHFLGKFTEARLIAPGGAPKPLEIYPTEEGGGVDVPEVGVCAAVILR
jgi:hypothetical protein